MECYRIDNLSSKLVENYLGRRLQPLIALSQVWQRLRRCPPNYPKSVFRFILVQSYESCIAIEIASNTYPAETSYKTSCREWKRDEQRLALRWYVKRIDVVSADEVDPILVDCTDEVAELMMSTYTTLSEQAATIQGTG